MQLGEFPCPNRCREMSIKHSFYMSCRLEKRSNRETWMKTPLSSTVGVLQVNLDCCPEFMIYLCIISLFSPKDAQSLQPWLSRKCIVFFLYAAIPAAHRGLVVFLTISFSVSVVTFTNPHRKVRYILRREESQYSSWDFPIQSTSLKKTLLSWSVDHCQSWEIGQWRLSASL